METVVVEEKGSLGSVARRGESSDPRRLVAVASEDPLSWEDAVAWGKEGIRTYTQERGWVRSCSATLGAGREAQ